MDKVARSNNELYREALTPTGMRMGLVGRPCAKSRVIPGGIDADRYAHGVGGAAMRKIKELYQRTAK